MKPRFGFLRSSMSRSLVLVTAATVTSAHASLWNGGAADNNWDNLSNWDTNPSGGVGQVDTLTNIPIITANNSVVPNDLKIAAANPTSTGQVDIRSGTFAINYWGFVGDWGGNATLNIAAGTNSSPGTYSGLDLGSGSFNNTANSNGNFMVGLFNSTGTVNMNTSGSLNVSQLRISPNGQNGSGTFNLDNGTVNVAGNVEVSSTFWGDSASSVGNFKISGGTSTPSDVNVGGAIFVGQGIGTGNVTIDGGTVDAGGNISVAQGAGNGNLDINGGTVSAAGEFITGYGGNGTTTQTDGIVNSSAWFVVGRNNGSVGEYNLEGGTVNAATSTFGSFAVVGSFAGSQGTLNVSGGLLTTGGNRKMFIGESGTGTLNLSGDGHVLINNNVTGDGFRLGALAGGSGTANLDGGELEVAYVAKGAGSGTFNFNGGRLTVASNHDGSKTFMSGLTAANVEAGGALIDTNGNAAPVVISQNLLDAGGGGGLTKDGAGTLVLGGANTYTGDTVVSVGTLYVNGSLGGGTVSVVNGATVGGGGSIGGNLSLAAGALFAFSETDTLSVTGTVSLDSTFGVDDLVGLSAATPDGTYTLIDITGTDFSALGIENWGEANKYTLGANKFAWFEQGSLDLVVVPEPGAALLGSIGMLALLRRRRSA